MRIFRFVLCCTIVEMLRAWNECSWGCLHCHGTQLAEIGGPSGVG